MPIGATFSCSLLASIGVSLKFEANKGNISDLMLLNGDQILVKMSIVMILMFLKVEVETFKNALQNVQYFSLPSGLQCSIKKSRFISFT